MSTSTAANMDRLTREAFRPHDVGGIRPSRFGIGAVVTSMVFVVLGALTAGMVLHLRQSRQQRSFPVPPASERVAGEVEGGI